MCLSMYVKLGEPYDFLADEEVVDWKHVCTVSACASDFPTLHMERLLVLSVCVREHKLPFAALKHNHLF
jgi:hypothetical protein